ncbi:transmembrane protein, putative [Bodo saltans]|uniref:Transmembrane protein, putative n=1 Tax=Bodo saltans TaxID=75058 RepID=A0A0S4IME2_BODSA|nr:transmembrane protein, putative [Bodo saltans]|eukprot:CUE65383.1 transmembrane protein, putative [Bodo saltans]
MLRSQPTAQHRLIHHLRFHLWDGDVCFILKRSNNRCHKSHSSYFLDCDYPALCHQSHYLELWQPLNAKSSYGGIVSPYVEQWRRAWIVLPAANIVVQILNGIDANGGSTCDALQGLTLCVLACVCAFIAYARPHRALLASYLVCASLVLTMVTALLGLLCRHGAVSPDAVSGFGVFASVAMFVFKLYHVLMFFVEKRQSSKLSTSIESAFLPNGSELSKMSERPRPRSGANRRRSPQLHAVK